VGKNRAKCLYIILLGDIFKVGLKGWRRGPDKGKENLFEGSRVAE